MSADTALPQDAFEFRPATVRQWGDLQALFSQMGQSRGCWCMWWRLKRAEFSAQYGEGNRRALQQIVASGQVPGILAYHQGQAVGWCSVAPREAFPVLDRSHTLKRVDGQPVWSIVCFFVAPSYRGRGLSEALIRAAIAYAEENGATMVEAYPAIPENSADPDAAVYTGVITTFERLGFREVARRSPIRAILRYAIAR